MATGDKGRANIGDVRTPERAEPCRRSASVENGRKAERPSYYRKGASGMLTYVLAEDGSQLMPTFNIKKVRKLLKSGRAVIAGHKPGLTIQLLYPVERNPQEIEACVDAGSRHIGLSIKSEKHEYVHCQYDLLDDEKERHDECRKYRRTRRNRKRYRKPRFDNRKRDKGWLAPSIENKMMRHADLIDLYRKVLPITSITVEVASFDTQLLEALESGKPLPEETDYQHGPMYGHDTRREAVFYRDQYTCKLCGKSPFANKGIILRMHHIGYWKDDHSDRMANLATLCTRCHSPRNHKKGGKLYGWEPEIRPLTGAAFMNTVRWKLCDVIESRTGIKPSVTYGAVTKRERLTRHIEKTHANDAYCMGKLRPGHKAREEQYVKLRRNNRILEKFYDAEYTDARDGSKKKAAELPCGRTKRSESRRGPKNERRFRGQKLSAGRRSIRRKHYQVRPGDICEYGGTRFVTAGTQHCGENVTYKGTRTIALDEALPLRDKKTGKEIRVTAGGKCTYRDKTRKVLAVDAGKKTVTIGWQCSFKAADVTLIAQVGGWQRIN